jgi:hypothetical protein
MGHRDVAQIERLAERMDCAVWVHYDAKSARQEHERLAASPKLDVVPNPVRVSWGHWSVITATLRGLAAIRGDPTHVILLSGQTYPIKPTELLREHLGSTTYLHHFPLPFEPWGRDGGLDRIAYRYARRPRWLSGRFRVPAMVRLPGRLQPPPVQPYGGSQWCVLHRDARRYLLDLPGDHPANRMYRRALVPDEGFIHTVLANSPLAGGLINDSLHFMKWGSSAHPEPISESDLPALRESSAFFTRKVAADDPLLDRIDQELLSC